MNESDIVSDKIYTNNALLTRLLSQLDETLKMSLTDVSGNIGTMLKSIEKNNSVDAATGKSTLELALQIKRENIDKFNELRSSIISTATEITTAYESYVNNTKQLIEQGVSETYVATSTFGEYCSETNTAISENASAIALGATNLETAKTELEQFVSESVAGIKIDAESIASEVANSFVTKNELEEFRASERSASEQTAKNITDSFSQVIEQKINDVAGAVDDNTVILADISAYIRRGELESGVYGIEIGRNDSNVKARFTNEKLSFLQGSTEVAYISGSALFITRGEFLDYMKIGNTVDGYFTFDVTSNGLEVRWNG